MSEISSERNVILYRNSKKEKTTKGSASSAKRWRRLARILCCVTLLFALNSALIMASAETTPVAGSPEATIDEMNEFTFEHYKVICRICIPMAIISFASCGFKFLGAIFSGSYAASGGGDMQKAQKQFFMTILAVLFLILLPSIFGGAVDFFKQSAWTP